MGRSPKISRYPERIPTPASRALRAARRAVRLRMVHVAAAVRVHSRTVARWESGETKPSPKMWRLLLAFFNDLSPTVAHQLALAAGLEPPAPKPVTVVDAAMVERALLDMADQLDVSPRRLRAAVRDLVVAVTNANGSLSDLMAAVGTKTPSNEPLPS